MDAAEPLAAEDELVADVRVADGGGQGAEEAEQGLLLGVAGGEVDVAALAGEDAVAAAPVGTAPPVPTPVPGMSTARASAGSPVPGLTSITSAGSRRSTHARCGGMSLTSRTRRRGELEHGGDVVPADHVGPVGDLHVVARTRPATPRQAAA